MYLILNYFTEHYYFNIYKYPYVTCTRMPRKGYKSKTLKNGWEAILIRDEDYEYLKSLYEEKEPELRKQGITDFDGFAVKLLFDAVELDKKRTQE